MPKMTFTLTVILQCAAGFFQIVLDPAADAFGWTPAIAKFLHAVVGGIQTVQGILAHTYNKDGTKPSEVPVATMTETIPQKGQGPTTIKTEVEMVSRKTE